MSKKKQLRTKEIEVDGEKYKIAVLSAGQVDELIFANFEMKEEDGVTVATVHGTKKALQERIAPVVAASLNNAIAGNGKWFMDGWAKPAEVQGDDWWEPSDIVGGFGYPEAMLMHFEITTFSKLRTSVEKAKATKGELEAVDTSESK